MSDPDRPAPTDPGQQNWTEDDPEATRIVQRDAMPGQSAEPAAPSVGAQDAAGGPPSADGGDEVAGTGAVPDGTATSDGDDSSGDSSEAITGPQPAVSDAGSAGGHDPDAEPTATAPPNAGYGTGSSGYDDSSGYGSGYAAADSPGYTDSSGYAAGSGYAADSGYAAGPGYGSAQQGYGAPDAATSYIGAPTTAYPPLSGPQGYGQQQPGYYQQAPGYPGPGAPGPQVVPPPATANVVLPPVRLPKAESRVALNVLGSIVGLLLVCGGLVLALTFASQMRTVDTAGLGDLPTDGSAPVLVGDLDMLAVVLTIVGALLIAVAALLAAWASWAPIVPGVLLAAASVWAMVTTGAGSGGARIADATSWAFDSGQFAMLCMNGLGLTIGLVLLATGLAAVFLRAGVRRTIRQQLETMQT